MWDPLVGNKVLWDPQVEMGGFVLEKGADTRARASRLMAAVIDREERERERDREKMVSLFLPSSSTSPNS